MSHLYYYAHSIPPLGGLNLIDNDLIEIIFRVIEGVLGIHDDLIIGATSLNKHNKIVKNVL